MELEVNEHYSQQNLSESIFEALKISGKYHSLSEDDLAPIDQFHIGGKEATFELAQLAGIKEGMRILDVGGGIGGAARSLAQKFNCKIDVLDITEEYCKVGEKLTIRADLSNKISFYHGSALDIPFPHMCFDVVWTQHSSMNISDKARLYSEMFRVLKPKGKLAFHEIIAGNNSPIYFPVPWARHGAISFLSSSNYVIDILKNIGFKELIWIDKTVYSLKWFNNHNVTSKSSPLGIHLIFGDDTKEMMKNQIRNLNENRISVVMGIFERASFS